MYKLLRVPYSILFITVLFIALPVSDLFAQSKIDAPASLPSPITELYVTPIPFIDTITVTAHPHGTVTPSGSVTVARGSNQTFTITPDAGYHVQDLWVDTTSVGAGTSYTMTNITGNHTFQAFFEINQYTLNAASAGNGTVNADPNTATYAHGDSVTLTAVPASGYLFDAWSGDASGSANPLTVVMDGNKSITASFVTSTLTITASIGGGGTITPSGAVPVTRGDSAVFTITADVGFYISNVLVDGISAGAPTTYTFTDVTADHTIEAFFAANNFIISIASGNWSDTLTWNYNGVNRKPISSDSVVIQAGHTVNLNQLATVGAITVEGTLKYNSGAYSLNVNTSASHSKSGDANIPGTLWFNTTDNTQNFRAMGNFSLTGTLINGASTGSIIHMAGSGQRTFFSADTLRRLRVSNNQTLELLNDVYVTTELILSQSSTGGKIKLDEHSLHLLSGASTALTGATSSYYVITDSTGKFYRHSVGISGAFFPVGTAASYNPVRLTPGTGTSNFSVRVIDGVNPAIAYADQAIQKTWDIADVNPGNTGTWTVSLHWSDADEGAAFTQSSATAFAYDDGATAWVEHPFITVDSDVADPDSAVLTDVSLSTLYIIGNPLALPVQLAAFSGHAVENQSVLLEWTTASEISSYGYFIERRAKEGSFLTVSDLIASNGTSLEEHAYSWTDRTVSAGTYYYRLKMVDSNGDVAYSGEIEVIVTSVLAAGDAGQPLTFGLRQNYPNPFNPSTTFDYSLAEAEFVTLTIYNILGETVATLVSGFQEPGSYSIHWDASGFPSGQYLYRLSSGSNTEVRKMVLLK